MGGFLSDYCYNALHSSFLLKLCTFKPSQVVNFIDEVVTLYTVYLMAKKKFHIGTSGWSYPDWKSLFYPKEIKSTDWLHYYANTFSITEINMSFYHLPKKQTVEKWVEKVPDNFLFCPKMSKYLTHIKRLKDPEETLENFFDVFEPMKDKMGPILIQTPPSLHFDYDIANNLYQLLQKKYKDYRFAMEGRHESWLTIDSVNLMAKYNIAFVVSQSGVGFPYAEYVTAKDIYIRFHGPGKLYASSYSDAEIKKFAKQFNKWIKDGHQLWIFFNNCYYTYAIQNALALEHLLHN